MSYAQKKKGIKQVDPLIVLTSVLHYQSQTKSSLVHISNFPKLNSIFEIRNVYILKIPPALIFHLTPCLYILDENTMNKRYIYTFIYKIHRILNGNVQG